MAAESVDSRDRHGFIHLASVEMNAQLHMTFVLSSRPTVAVPISLDFVGPKDGADGNEPRP